VNKQRKEQHNLRAVVPATQDVAVSTGIVGSAPATATP
jgi:hypothetical protein